MTSERGHKINRVGWNTHVVQMQCLTERMELYPISSRKLDDYIGKNLHPSKEFQQNVQDAVNRICSFLKEMCKLDARVIKTVKAGSAGKGTTLDKNSDVDLVIFLSCFSSFQDQAEKREDVLKIIENNLNNCIQSLAFKIDISPQRRGTTAPRSLSLFIQAKRNTESVDVDILPAYDVLGQISSTYEPPVEVYIDLIEANGQPGEFNTSFTELQRNFVKYVPAKLKDLLRLVKYWYKEIKKHSESLPPKFALELLTIYAWEEGTKRAEQFNTAEGFCTVMMLINQYQDLCLFWSKYYSLEHPKIGLHVKEKLKGSRPVIMDPADPTANIAKASGEAWVRLAEEASYCQKQQCCMKDDEPCKPWNVQPARDIQVTVKQHTGATSEISCSPFASIKEIKKQMWKEGQPYDLCLEEPGQENIVLQNDKTLAYYGIFYNTTIQLHHTTSKQIEIFVKDFNSRTTNYTVNSNETVLGLKKMIEARRQVVVHQQHLTYNDKELEDGNTLASYNIRSKETVYLLLRLRGGHSFIKTRGMPSHPGIQL